MASNYPPGVIGNEYEIAGPDYEEEVDGPCPECDSVGTLMAYGYDSRRWVACSGWLIDEEDPCPYSEEVDDTCIGCNRPGMYCNCP